MVKRIVNRLRTETSKRITTLIAGLIIGAAVALVSGAWNTAKIPWDNRRAIKTQEQINKSQQEILENKVDKTEFYQYKREEAIKEKSINEKLDIIIELIKEK